MVSGGRRVFSESQHPRSGRGRFVEKPRASRTSEVAVGLREQAADDPIARRAASGHPVVIGVDLDGTAGDYYTGLRNSVVRRRGISHDDLLDDAEVGYELEEWFPKPGEHAAAHHAAVSDGMFRTMPAKEGAVDVLKRLHARGARLAVVTRRGSANFEEHPVQSRQDTHQWIADNEFPFAEIHFGVEGKQSVPCDIYLDDSPDEIENLQTAGRPVIIFHHGYNAHLPGPRAYNWRDAEQLVSRWAAGEDIGLPDPPSRTGPTAG